MDMKKLSICFGILITLLASRLIPHPPNFTSLLALSFYVPVLLGFRYLPVLIISFAITDLVIGFHSGVFWTWGSVMVIGLMSRYFNKNINFRLIGSSFGVLIFYLITNFGVWYSGLYGLTAEGFVECYVLALPFFAYSFISTILFSVFVETIYKIYKIKFLKI